MLDVKLSAICSRNQYTRDPGPVIDELHRMAGDRLDILAKSAGTWAGYYRGEYTSVLADALLEIPGAAAWASVGRARRAKQPHSTQT